MNYEELGIFALRNIARKVGVKSPTQLKKRELINSIVKINNGEVEPYVRKTNQGRPVNKLGTEIIVNELKTKEEEDCINFFYILKFEN